LLRAKTAILPSYQPTAQTLGSRIFKSQDPGFPAWEKTLTHFIIHPAKVQWRRQLTGLSSQEAMMRRLPISSPQLTPDACKCYKWGRGITMQKDKTQLEEEAGSLREAKKKAQKTAMAEFKRLHALDPEKAREAARLWFAANAEQSTLGETADDPFHRRKLAEADPERGSKAAEALRKEDADAGRAQNASRETVKQWRKRNPNKVKKLGKLYREGQKPQRS
jgi:hypothetical protein